MKCFRGVVLVLLAAMAALSGAQSFRLLRSTFLDIRGRTDELPMGVAASADGGGYSATSINGLQLAKYDSTGALVWEQRLAMGNTADLLVQEGATGVYVAGSVERGFPTGSQTFLVKYDFAGNRLFTRFLTGDPGLWPRQMMLEAGDNVFLLASSPDNASLASSYLIKCNSKGDTIWQSKLTDYTRATVGRMHRDSTGNFYVAGSGWRVGVTGTEAFVTKLDPNGGKIWLYRYAEAPNSFSGYDAIPAADGSVYAAFIYSDEAQGGFGTQLHKLSAAGAKVWSIGWPDSRNEIVALDPAGNCIASVSAFGGTYSTVKVSPAGFILWNRPLLGYVRDVATDAAGNITLLGGDNNPGVSGAMKVDPNGNPIWSLGPPDDTGIKEFSRGDIMVSRQFVDSTGVTDHTTLTTRRVNPSKTILWTSNGITNDHQSEISAEARMVGAVNAIGTTLFWSGKRFIGIAASGQTAFDVADGSPFSWNYYYRTPPPSQVLPTSDGGFLTNVNPKMVRRFSNSGGVLWEVSFHVPYEEDCAISPMYLDPSGNIYLRYTSLGGISGFAKLSSGGAVLWKFVFPVQPRYNLVQAVLASDQFTVVDAAGNAFTEFLGELWKFSPSGAPMWHSALPLNPSGDPAYGRILADPLGNVYITSNRYSGGTTQGWIAKFTPDGKLQFDSVLATGDNSPMEDTILYKDRLYSVGSTRINGISMMAVFCLDCQTGNVWWVATLNPGYQSKATRVFVDETVDELRIAGWRYSPTGGYDYALVGMNLSGVVTRVSSYDSGYSVNEYGRIWGVDSQHNYYIAGAAMGPSDTYDYNVVKFSLPPPDWASIELPAVVAKMATGTSYSGTVKVTNMGLNTWTAAGGYKLDCVQPTTWALTSVPLASGDSIAPGQSKVFSFTVTAPTTPGAYPLTFRMEHSGTQFDNSSASYGIQVMTQTNFASFVGQTVSTSMVAGQSYAVSLQYKNTGSNTWTPGTGYKLQSVNPLNNTTWGMNRLALTNSSVPPGATGTFSGTVIAPMTSGTYNFQWQPIQDTTGLAFGSPSTNVAITVTNVGDAARYISKTGAVTVNAGADFYVQNTMMNVGSNPWTTSTGYSLRALYGGWGAMNMYLPGSLASVAPGAQATFTKLLTAPLTPGTYPMQWQMLHGSTLFGDKTPYLSMNVVQGPYNAKFNSQSVVSTSVGAGTTFGCTFSMQNLGTNTWDSTVKLASMGSNSFGVPAIAVSGTVVQNASSSFTATFTAPTTPGTYTLQFRMQNPSGTFFGQPTTPVTIVVTAADAAQYLSKTGPLIVNAGSDFWVQNTFKNTGTSTWSSATGFSLRSVNPTDNLTWGRNRIYLPGTGSVAPGGSVTLTGPCTAPSVPGTYTMQWQMTHGATLFGEKTPALTITVVQSADNAIFLTQTVVPVSVAHGTTFTVNFAMQNAGTATWGAGYNLVPIGSSTWGLSPIASGVVPPDGQHTFTATCTAPSTPGTYTFQMRMDHNGTKFGQATKLVTVTVT